MAGIIKTIFLIVLLPVVTFSGTIETEILQSKLNRLYFPVGSESQVFKSAQFKVYVESTVVVEGEIEELFNGVSISNQYDDFFALNEDLQYTVVIETMDSDNDSKIKIASDGISLNDIFINNSNSTTIDISPGDTRSEYDLYVTFKETAAEPFASYPAPFIAVQIPLGDKNIKSDILSTALYYHFNAEYSSFLFDGSELNIADCLFPTDSSCKRSYQFNPGKGNKLIKSVKTRKYPIYIYHDNPALEQTSNYYADLLGRKNFYVEIISSDEKSSLITRFIPFKDSDPAEGLKFILSYLSRRVTAPEILETISILNGHLQSANDTDEPQMRDYFYKLIDYSLKYDLGVFPLFRPTIYVYKSDLITEPIFDDDNRIDLSTFKKFKKPKRVSK